jgi:cysteine-rich repeat protein
MVTRSDGREYLGSRESDRTLKALRQAVWGAFVILLSRACAAQGETVTLVGVVPDGVYIQPVAQVRDQISPEERQRIEQRIEQNVVRLRAEGRLSAAPVPRQPPTVLLDWPLQASPGFSDPGFYGISNYVDHDLSYPNNVLDYHCGTRTYDLPTGYNHRGTDIFTSPFPWNKMDADQVQVVAAAAGTIIDKADGNYDRNCAFNGMPANYLIIQHSDNSRAWYVHLKNGSLTTKAVGQTVVLGEYLGIVGSSGDSTGPHLHFEVYDSSNQLNDPWMGPCNTFNATSWWNVQQTYRVPTLLHLSTGTAPVDSGTCPNGETTNEQNCFNPGDTIYFRVYFRDMVLNDTFVITIRRPDNSVFSSSTRTSNADYDVFSFYQYFTNFSPGGPAGTWHWEVTFHSQTFTFPFYLSTNCAFPTSTPTLTPTATPLGGPTSTPTVTSTRTNTHTPTSASNEAAIFISGHDPDAHAQYSGGAASLMQKAFAFARQGRTSKFLFVQANQIIAPIPIPGCDPNLGMCDDMSNSCAPPRPYSISTCCPYGDRYRPRNCGKHNNPWYTLRQLGYREGVHYDRVDATGLARVNFSPYSFIFVPSDFGGLLRQQELDALVACKADIAAYLAAGGGLVAFAESGGGRGLTNDPSKYFQYLPFQVRSEVKPQWPTGNNTVTSYGTSRGFAKSDVNGSFSHNVFPDFRDNRFDAILVVDRDPAGDALSLAFRGRLGVCGNGLVEAGERCDDGNTTNGDGCSSVCLIPGCGNGLLEAGEQCDDGNPTNGDGCSSACQYELIPGQDRGDRACMLEFSVTNPNNVPFFGRRGRVNSVQTCRNNDPTCDFGTDPAACDFKVTACLNNVDPQLPSCAPPGVSSQRVRGPDAYIDPVNWMTLTLALGNLRDPSTGTTGHTLPLLPAQVGFCTDTFSIHVPLGGRQTLRVVTRATSTARDRDRLVLICQP